MGWPALIPWRLLVPLLLIGGVAGGLAWGVHEWGQRRFDAGYIARNTEISDLVMRKNAEQARLQDRLQGNIDALDQRLVEREARTNELVAAFVADGDRLRDEFERRARAARARVPTSPTPQGTCPPDDGAAAAWELLGPLEGVAEQCAANAERLANQVRGLQSYAREVEGQAIECNRSD